MYVWAYSTSTVCCKPGHKNNDQQMEIASYLWYNCHHKTFTFPDKKGQFEKMSISDTLIEIIDAWTYFNMALGMAGNLFTLIAIPYAAKRKR